MAKILVVDDEKNLRDVIRTYAEFQGYEVAEASDGSDAVTLCRNNKYDLIIMDIMMPKVDGFSAVKEIRKFSSVPVIMLSARGEEYDKLFGFELGIDDYVTKPYSPKELMARVNAVLLRANAKSAEKKMEKEVYDIEGLHVDVTSRIVTIDGKEAKLTPKEYELLFYLLKNKGIALSREKLISEIWGYDFFGDDRTLDTHVKMLRQNLGPYRDKVITLRSMGYKFVE